LRGQPNASNLEAVVRRSLQFAIAFVLTIAVLAPMAELFDHWDKGVVPANDTELCVTATCAFAGLIVTIALTVRPATVPAANTFRERMRTRQPQGTRAVMLVVPAASPPTVPLRI
jgi:hypothetical protein